MTKRTIKANQEKRHISISLSLSFVQLHEKIMPMRRARKCEKESRQDLKALKLVFAHALKTPLLSQQTATLNLHNEGNEADVNIKRKNLLIKLFLKLDI